MVPMKTGFDSETKGNSELAYLIGIQYLTFSSVFSAFATAAKNPRLTPGPDPSSPSNLTRRLL